MSYQFKGIDITTIVDTTTDPQPTNFADVYRGLPDITPPQYNNSRLLTNLGYTDANRSDLSTVCAAIHQKYNYSQRVNVPSGANQFRYFIIGGSGGGGGGGGVANNSGVQGNGGNGGNGSSGQSTSGTTTIAPGYSLQITIGSGGGGGGPGAYTANNNSGDGVGAAGGGSGGSGGSTSITNNYSGTVSANGGGGGGGSGGGWAFWSRWNANGASDGAAGNNGNVFNSGSTGWDPRYVTSQWGGGGGGGGYNWSSNGAPGNAGQPGYAVIVWLYD